MIISASRRTDIPSYYGSWFLNRLRQGFVLIANPYQPKRLTRLCLSPDTVDCIVFWTKNPAPMAGMLDEISGLGYPFYFQYTITPYGKPWESNLPPVQKRVETLRLLSERIGRHRVVWRYDPIMISPDFPLEYHIERFAALCEQLHPHVDQCIISFVDGYAHLKGAVPAITTEQMRTVGKAFSHIAAPYGLALATCSEQVDLRAYGIKSASCIDRARIERLAGCRLKTKKDPGQRPECGCIESVDVGAYGTCLNGCGYCYATRSAAAAQRSYALHDPDAPMLTGWPKSDEIVVEKEARSQKLTQMSLFDD